MELERGESIGPKRSRPALRWPYWVVLLMLLLIVAAMWAIQRAPTTGAGAPQAPPPVAQHSR